MERVEREPRTEADTQEVDALKRRLELAEQVCLMVGWTAADNTDRGKAKHELWAAWKAEYEAQGGSHEPRRHPELSDARIRELARQRDETVAATIASLRVPS